VDRHQENFMRPTFVPLALLSLAVPGAAFAQAAPATAAGPVTRAPVTAKLDADFAQIDLDKNGKLTKTEIEKGQTDAIAKSRAEMVARRDAQFKKIDTDGNGQISKSEFDAGVTLPKLPIVNAAPVLGRYDTNKDGAVSVIEFRGPTMTSFDKLDTNKDGQLCTAEQAKAPSGL
jgi:hypothetical protein